MNKYYTNIIILISLICLPSLISSQVDTTASVKYESEFLGISTSIYLDSFVITASKGGFDLEDFIELVISDTSFYNAFIELRKKSYDFNHSITYYDRKDRIKAHYESHKYQSFNDNCREMSIITESHSGKYYKKKKSRYYTSRLFSQIFETKGKICNDGNTGPSSKNKRSSIEYHIDLIKQVIFSPGIETNMPLVGKKMAIFSVDMQKYYNYSITSKKSKDSIDCYVFDVDVKDKYKDNKNDVIVRNLSTYFEKGTLNIIARDYTLKYKNLLYDFDIDISVRLDSISDYNIPSYIKFNGFWDIVLKSPEKTIFEVEFYNFK